MQYQTKHLEATTEISHGDKFLKPGDTFHASEIDADHYLSRGMAKHAKAEPAKTPPPAAKTALAAPARPTPTPRTAVASTRTTTPRGIQAAPSRAWDVTEPIKLADVPHADTDTPPKADE